MNRKRTITMLVAGLIALGGTVGVATPAVATETIHCDLNVQYPHGSSHVSGTVNVQARTTCPIVMKEIYIRTWLQKSTGGTWTGASQDRFNLSTLAANSATSCTNAPGSFRGYATTIVHAPAGWTPASRQHTVYGSWRYVSCQNGGALVSPEALAFDPDESAAKATVSFTRDSGVTG